MALELLAATTSATQSDKFDLGEDSKVTLIMYAASGLTAGEYGDIQVSHDEGTTWQDLYQEGSQVRLHSTNNITTIYGSGVYRVDKEATTNATGLWVSKEGNL